MYEIANIKTPNTGKSNHSERCKYPPIKLTIIARSVASKIPLILLRILPLTSLGEESSAPTVIVTPICKASSFMPIRMGVVSAIPNRIALEKSVLLKNSVKSLIKVPTMVLVSLNWLFLYKQQR